MLTDEMVEAAARALYGSESPSDKARAMARAALTAAEGVGAPKTCATCKFFAPDKSRLPYGGCERWNEGYGYDTTAMPLNEVLVENDEGWAMLMGPDFGCVLWEPSPPNPDGERG